MRPALERVAVHTPGHVVLDAPKPDALGRVFVLEGIKERLRKEGKGTGMLLDMCARARARSGASHLCLLIRRALHQRAGLVDQAGPLAVRGVDVQLPTSAPDAFLDPVDLDEVRRQMSRCPSSSSLTSSQTVPQRLVSSPSSEAVSM